MEGLLTVVKECDAKDVQKNFYCTAVDSQKNLLYNQIRYMDTEKRRWRITVSFRLRTENGFQSAKKGAKRSCTMS